MDPVCAVINPELFGGSYVEFPGAWLRVAPDRSTGGIVATADHLVLDSALFQHLLIKLARVTTTSSRQWCERRCDGIHHSFRYWMPKQCHKTECISRSAR